MGGPNVKLSLSARVAESYEDKRMTTMPFDGLAKVTKESGFHAVCMRASAAGVHTTKEEVLAMRGTLDTLGLDVSMVTGDFSTPMNDEEGPNALRNITPHLDLANSFRCDLIRVCMKRDEDIGWAQRACDEAKEREIRISHQCHHASLFETVEASLSVIHRVNRVNFGVTYEPANLEACGEEYRESAIRRLAPHMFNVYLQNQRVNPNGAEILETWLRGPFHVDNISLDQPGGIDFSAVFDGLAAVGYDGYVTVHQASAQLMSVPEAAKRSAMFLRSLADFVS